jgi:hypothetical protein
MTDDMKIIGVRAFHTDRRGDISRDLDVDVSEFYKGFPVYKKLNSFFQLLRSDTTYVAYMLRNGVIVVKPTAEEVKKK